MVKNIYLHVYIYTNSEEIMLYLSKLSTVRNVTTNQFGHLARFFKSYPNSYHIKQSGGNIYNEKSLYQPCSSLS